MIDCKVGVATINLEDRNGSRVTFLFEEFVELMAKILKDYSNLKQMSEKEKPKG